MFDEPIERIDREVGEQSKGFRLQKLRAISLLLRKMKEKRNVAVCAATEFEDDVYTLEVKEDGVRETYTEGDKNYDPKVSFSFSAAEVRNSIIIFLDCWLSYQMSDSHYFGFYTNVRYGREYNTRKTRRLGITLPDKPILQLLSQQDYDYPNLLPAAKAIIIDEYETQYGINSRNVAILKAWDDTMWKDFFNRIDWQFEKDDEKKLEELLLSEICGFGLVQLLPGKEELVLSLLEHEIEKRQATKDNYARLVPAELVENIMLKVAGNVAKKSDPVHKMWNELDEPTDKRNLSLKIEAVCSNFPQSKLGKLARRVSAAKLELDQTHYEFSAAFRYRLFEGCEDKLEELIRGHRDNPITPEVIDFWIEQLFLHCRSLLQDTSKDYAYELQNETLIRNTILELFDSCYMNFEGEAVGS